MKYYKIDEHDLKNLLEDLARLQYLEFMGVDNWNGAEGYKEEFIASCFNISTEEAEEQELGFEDVANKWLEDYEIVGE